MGSLRNSKGARNFGWLMIDRGVRLSVSVIVSTWIARYLGPGNFGLLNFAASLTAIFAAVVPLGIDGLVVRDLIQRPDARGGIVGTTVGLRLSAAVAAICVSIAYVLVARPGDVPALLLTAILSTGLLAQAFESGELVFQAHTDMGRLVVPRLLLFLALNAIKISLILSAYSVFWFAAITAAEQIVSGILTQAFVRRYHHFRQRLRFSLPLARHLVAQGYPLAVSALAIIIYMKAGQLMLAQMLGDTEMGLFSAAIRIPDCTLFLPTALASSVLPALVRAHQRGGVDYERSILAYMRLSAAMGFAVALPMAVTAPWMMQILFGDEYASAWPTLSVYVLAFPFMFLGVARAQHLLNERQMKLSLYFSLAGLILNLGANFMLIPAFGKMGAAISAVASQAISAVIASLLPSRTREIGRMQCVALLTPWLAVRDFRRQRSIEGAIVQTSS